MVDLMQKRQLTNKKKNNGRLTSKMTGEVSKQLYEKMSKILLLITPKPIGKRHFTVRLEKPHMPILLLYGFQTDCLHEHSLPFYYIKVYTND